MMIASLIKVAFGSPSTNDSFSTFVDFRVIEEADLLLEDCESFLVQAQTNMKALPFSAFSTIRNWRAKRRDNQLYNLYELLRPRIKDAENNLRAIIGEVAEKKNALRLQARYLQIRLDSCICYNKEILDNMNNPADDLRGVVNRLTVESSYVKSMVTFNSDLLRQRNVESVNRGKSLVPWSAKNLVARQVTEADLMNDPDHSSLLQRLRMLREHREKYVDYLSSVLEYRETFTSNLNSCEASRVHLTGLLKRDYGGIEDEPLDPTMIEFDHCRCTDCSYGCTITSDCTNNLVALRQQAIEANTRLQSLVEIRERIGEIASEIELGDSAGDLLPDVPVHVPVPGPGPYSPTSNSSPSSPSPDTPQDK